MNERFINEVSRYLERDRNTLIRIQGYRGALKSNNRLNEKLIRRCARGSLRPMIQLFQDKQISVKQIFEIIHQYYKKDDEEKIFNLIFFYYVFYSEDLPDLLLPLAINKAALRIYFNEWLREIKRTNI